MSLTNIQEGDLDAFINGYASSEVVATVERSPEHQQKANELRQVDQFLTELFAEVKPLNPQDLVDVASGHASANQRLIVAKHCRLDPAVAAELAELEQAWQEMIEQETESATDSWLDGLLKLPEFIAVPLLTGANARTGQNMIRAQPVSLQSYEVAELEAKITLRVVPPEGEIWQIEGYVTQRNSPVTGALIELYSEESDPESQATDEYGFFAFGCLWEGTCCLHITLPDGIVIIPEITLMEEDDLLL